jgi:hypothetical protein
MKYPAFSGTILFCLLIFLGASCGGNLSEEQRKKLLEGQKSQEIKKISEGELLQLALTEGSKIAERAKEIPVAKLDTLSQLVNARVVFMTPGNSDAAQLESRLIDAYMMGLATGSALQDNIQKKGIDSLLFTRAIVEKRADGVDELKGMWCITLSKKQLILSMK